MLSTALTQEERAARMKEALEQVLKPPRPQVVNPPGGERVKALTKARPDALTPPAKDRDRSRR